MVIATVRLRAQNRPVLEKSTPRFRRPVDGRKRKHNNGGFSSRLGAAPFQRMGLRSNGGKSVRVRQGKGDERGQTAPGREKKEPYLAGIARAAPHGGRGGEEHDLTVKARNI